MWQRVPEQICSHPRVRADHSGAPRREFDRLKATLHNAVLYGPASQNRGGHPDFRAHLAGRVAWVRAVNSARGERLRRDFDRIDWTA